jgi:hypothetical protein
MPQGRVQWCGFVNAIMNFCMRRKSEDPLASCALSGGRSESAASLGTFRKLISFVHWKTECNFQLFIHSVQNESCPLFAQYARNECIHKRALSLSLSWSVFHVQCRKRNSHYIQYGLHITGDNQNS